MKQNTLNIIYKYGSQANTPRPTQDTILRTFQTRRIRTKTLNNIYKYGSGANTTHTQHRTQVQDTILRTYEARNRTNGTETLDIIYKNGSRANTTPNSGHRIRTKH